MDATATKTLGPKITKRAGDNAEAVRLWAMRLEDEIRAGDIAAAQSTADVMQRVLARITTDLAKAK